MKIAKKKYFELIVICLKKIFFYFFSLHGFTRVKNVSPVCTDDNIQ